MGRPACSARALSSTTTPPSTSASGVVCALRRPLLSSSAYPRGPHGRCAPSSSRFFSFLLVDLDEYQLMQFIMSLKGTQFITGLFLALEGFVIFFSCSVFAQPSNCDVAGPAGTAVPWQAFYQLALQGMTWAASHCCRTPRSAARSHCLAGGRGPSRRRATRKIRRSASRLLSARQANVEGGRGVKRRGETRDRMATNSATCLDGLFRKIKGFDGAGAAAAAGGQREEEVEMATRVAT